MEGSTLARSPVPVISGVGHETDFTITDFVADLRAPTPTAAAELAVPDQVELRMVIGEGLARLSRSLRTAIADRELRLDNLSSRLERLSPQNEINNSRQRLDEISGRLAREAAAIIFISLTRIFA